MFKMNEKYETRNLVTMFLTWVSRKLEVHYVIDFRVKFARLDINL
jgi:hypothetical protein